MSELPRDSQFPNADPSLLQQAERQFQEAIALAPQTPDALHMLAAAAHQAGLHRLARELLDKILTMNSDHAGAHHMHARLFRDEGDSVRALATLHRAKSLATNSPDIHADLADVLRRTGKLDESLHECRIALSLDPARADSHHILGNTLYHLSRFDEAFASFEQAIALEPEHAAAHRSVAIIQFLRGNFCDAYPHYDFRWNTPGFRGTLERLGRPLWNGELLAGKTLLLHAEQGLGDTLQFVRYVPLIAKQNARIVLHVQPPLKRLCSHLPNVDVLLALGDTPPAFDLQCPLLSLPRVFDTSLETVPAKTPYLYPDAIESQKWRDRLPRDGKLHVGIAWSGNPLHSGDHYRSIPFAELLPLFSLQCVQFHSLKKQTTTPPTAHPDLIDHTDEFHDLAATAAYMSSLDLIVSVDTAIAHLAGALAQKTWTLLPHAPDWRWLLDRTDSPWYPTMTLFRQRSIGDWPGVIAQVARALTSPESSPPSPSPFPPRPSASP